MPVDVTTEIVIDRPRDVVSDFAADPDNVPKWYVNIKSVEWLTPRPLAVGSRVAFVAQFLGRRIAYTYEISTLLPGKQLVMRTAERAVSNGDPVQLGIDCGWRHPDDIEERRKP